MPIAFSQGWVPVEGRRYRDQSYRIVSYAGSVKVNLITATDTGSTNLKMTKEEAEELITRIQYAIVVAEGEIT